MQFNHFVMHSAAVKMGQVTKRSYTFAYVLFVFLINAILHAVGIEILSEKKLTFSIPQTVRQECLKRTFVGLYGYSLRYYDCPATAQQCDTSSEFPQYVELMHEDDILVWNCARNNRQPEGFAFVCQSGKNHVFDFNQHDRTVCRTMVFVSKYETGDKLWSPAGCETKEAAKTKQTLCFGNQFSFDWKEVANP